MEFRGSPCLVAASCHDRLLLRLCRRYEISFPIVFHVGRRYGSPFATTLSRWTRPPSRLSYLEGTKRSKFSGHVIGRKADGN